MQSTFVIIRQYVLIACILYLGQCYFLRCPESVQWNYRAKEFCNNTNDIKEYYCLLDIINGKYIEGCHGPDWDRKGSKRVIAGDFTRGNCSIDRYQPFVFRTTGNSDCVFSKTLCTEEGQVVSYNGSGKADRTCRCDFDRGFDYIHQPKDACDCRPFVEDCSCVQRKGHLNNVKCQRPVYEVPERSSYLVDISPNFVNKKGNGKKIVTTMTCGTIALVILFIITIILIGLLDSVDHISGDIDQDIHSKEIISDNKNDTLDSTAVADIFRRDKIKLTKDETNYLRIYHLISGVACPLVRMLFDIEIKPDQLGNYFVNNWMVLGKKIKHSDVNLSIFYPVKSDISETNSSDLFDIKLLINIMQDIVQSGDLKLMLGQLLSSRNDIFNSVSGTLSDDEFKDYWKAIGQATLKVAVTCSPQIGKRRTLKKRLLQLSSIQVGETKLRQFMYLIEKLPRQTMVQIIKEYCKEKYAEEEIIFFLKNEKHALLHRRKKQDNCCLCDDPTFLKVISDDVWNQLYVPVSVECSCERKSKCTNNFEVNTQFQLMDADTSLLIILLLHTPQLLRFVIERMFSRSFGSYLLRMKHDIYHEVETFCESKCCQCKQGQSFNGKHKLTIKDWEKMFSLSTKSKQCKFKQCACRFSVKDKITIDKIDDSIALKIMSVAGPIHAFNRDKTNQLEAFVQWNKDCISYQQANLKLLEVVRDSTFRRDMQYKINFPEPSAEDVEPDFLSKWLVRNVSVEKSTQCTDAVVFLQKDGKDEEFEAKKFVVSKFFKDQLLDESDRHFECTEDEQNVFKLICLLNKVVCPIVREEFDRIFGVNLTELLMTLEETSSKNVKHATLAKNNHKTTGRENTKYDDTRVKDEKVSKNDEQATETIVEKNKIVENIDKNYRKKNRANVKEKESDERANQSGKTLENDERAKADNEKTTEKHAKGKDNDEKGKENNEKADKKNGNTEKPKKLFRFSTEQHTRFFSGHRETPVTSVEFGLPLMIRILDEKRNDVESLKNDNDFFEKLKTITNVRRKITRNSSGTFNNNDFEKYWDLLYKVVIDWRGREWKPILDELQIRKDILTVDLLT